MIAWDAAISVLQQFGGTYEDSLAAKYLAALQALLLVGGSTGMAHAIVEALTPAIVDWTVE